MLLLLSILVSWLSLALKLSQSLTGNKHADCKVRMTSTLAYFQVWTSHSMKAIETVCKPINYNFQEKMKAMEDSLFSHNQYQLSSTYTKICLMAMVPCGN